MKKVFIIQRYAARFRKTFFEQLASSYDLTLVTSNEVEFIKVGTNLAGVNVLYSVYRDILWKIFFIHMNTLFHLHQHKPDVVILTPTPRDLTNFLVVVYCKIYKIRCVGWGMGKMPGRIAQKQFFHDILVSLLVKRLDGMICYSTVAAAYYEVCGVSRENISVAYNGVDTTRTYVMKKEKVLPASSSLNVLTVGRLIESKKFEILINAVLNVPGVQLTIIGDGPHRQHLEKISVGSKQVSFCGYVEGADLNKFYDCADLFVMPSLGGLAIHEALLAGCPVICGAADGTEFDLVVNNKTGFRIPELSESKLTKYLVECLSGHHDLIYMGKLSSRFIKIRRSRKIMLENFRKII